ncbi:MAG: pyridoxamine 5'-phosphate oxidase family protein [Candidatus Schekmanbacteria bacterium]|nr:pyridoxamine 5'-phosphate oxidase family protein [Candidatus Schekmanbacteria bacterium]
MADDLQDQMEKDFDKVLKQKAKRLNKEELEAAITDFLAKHILCTLATCDNNEPRATPIRYRSEGMNIFFLTEGGGKVKNMLSNPKVSVGIHGEYSGFDSVKGLQLWGTAEVIEPGDTERYKAARKAIRSEEREDLKKLGDLPIRDKLKAVKITVTKARYLNIPEGILNQVWEA